MRKLRPIEGYEGGVDIAYLQRKISAAGEMKSAIKWFLDWWDNEFAEATAYGDSKVKRLRKSMVDYLNS